MTGQSTPPQDTLILDSRRAINDAQRRISLLRALEYLAYFAGVVAVFVTVLVVANLDDSEYSRQAKIVGGTGGAIGGLIGGLIVGARLGGMASLVELSAQQLRMSVRQDIASKSRQAMGLHE